MNPTRALPAARPTAPASDSPVGPGAARVTRLRFPTSPDPRWTPDQRARWDTARQIAADHPATPGQGGWSVDRLPVATGALIGLAVLLAGGLASITLAVAVGTATAIMLGVAGIVVSGVTAMVLIWHTPPADHALAPPTRTVRVPPLSAGAVQPALVRRAAARNAARAAARTGSPR